MEAMKAKKTTELLRDLKKSRKFADYLKKNGAELRNHEFTETINRLFQSQGQSKAMIARAAGTSEAYLYQIFSGARVPSRNRLLCICIGMRVPVEDTQLLLRQCGYAPLYVRDKRDAAILYGLMHGSELSAVSDLLFENGEEPLLE